MTATSQCFNQTLTSPLREIIVYKCTNVQEKRMKMRRMKEDRRREMMGGLRYLVSLLGGIR
jgi:hypothetical protein